MNVIVLVTAALISSGSASPSRTSATIIYQDGKVWNGRGFDQRGLAVRDGRFVRLPRSTRQLRKVSLSGRFVVPPYGNAHIPITTRGRQPADPRCAAACFICRRPAKLSARLSSPMPMA